MSNELKEQMMFAIFTAEASEIDTTEQITLKMQEKYGGLWSAVAANRRGLYLYIQPAPGHLAVFDYDGKRWYVYEHDCSNQLYTLDTGRELVSSYALRAVDFRSNTRMNSTIKEQLLFALFTAETGNKVGQAEVDHIGRKMETVYGSHWSVWSYAGNGIGWSWNERPFYATFDYQAKFWVVFKNAC